MELVTASKNLTWYQPDDQQIFLADGIDHTTPDAAMSVGFVRWAAGEANEWAVSYDEALVITRGRVTVRSAAASVTAGVGEVIYLRAGEEIVYQGDEDAEAVYVTYPHWLRATEEGPNAARLAKYHPASI